ncbi:M-phase inducer phosphatase-like [Coccinella septempunctata]|uniref:M-phase inducer phosphatase-like n=1 Tax=Coccinella septempunctata TaxID=41139 RepID=UPI001D0614FA|nr:M-phase inducer phosphatase-like [Coccinella septempunctata]
MQSRRLQQALYPAGYKRVALGPEVHYCLNPGLADIITGKIRCVAFKIIDCRYPDEYNGGHIDGALNIYMREQCFEFLSQQYQKREKINILIFHCEFSSERGPNLCRYLRQIDRKRDCNIIKYNPRRGMQINTKEIKNG